MPIIPNRTGLYFEYPAKASDDTKRIVFLPFSQAGTVAKDNLTDRPTNNILHAGETKQYFSEIEVDEKKSARLVSYNTLNRNNTLYAHTGSTSRVVSLKVRAEWANITEGMLRLGSNTPATLQSMKDKFKFTTTPKNKRTHVGGATSNPKKFVKDTFLTCVTTHATNSVLGPPLIRLNYRGMWDHCLFVCSDVKFTLRKGQHPIVGAENQEPGTGEGGGWWPKYTDIVLSLNEVRATDGILFKPNQLHHRDGVAGWEAVLDGLGYDPGTVAYR